MTHIMKYILRIHNVNKQYNPATKYLEVTVNKFQLIHYTLVCFQIKIQMVPYS
jgi:hypothetical protein